MEGFISHWGYLAIFLLTIAESACIPIPSELTLGIGGALAAGVTLSGGVARHPLNLALVIVFGVLGELTGSTIAYTVGRIGGRPFVDRFGKYVLLTRRDLDRSEHWFAHKGEGTVLVGRVIPIIRTFISLPAGVAEMDPLRFGAYTFIGVTVWVGALSAIGYSLGGSWHKMVTALGAATYVFAGLVVLGLVLVVAHRIRALRAEKLAGAGADLNTAGADKDRTVDSTPSEV
jgi:membrane protein DedA with SNARE-associated domain